MLKVDLKKAGVALSNEKGKLDFHALRTAYINFVLRSNVDPKTMQTMARHASFDMTLNVYGRDEEELCHAAAESVGRLAFGTAEAVSGTESTFSGNRTLTEQQFQATANENATAFIMGGCVEKKVERAKRSLFYNKSLKYNRHAKIYFLKYLQKYPQTYGLIPPNNGWI